MTPLRIITISALMFAAFLLSACNEMGAEPPKQGIEMARPAKIVPVLSTGVSLMRTYPGTLEASERADLAFRVGGQLSELPAQAGLRVKKGDLLARLDAADYQNTFEERQARFDLAQIQHDQAKKLLEKNVTSQLQFDQTVSELKSARATLDRARDNLRYTRLLAPFDGIVARVDVENHQAIQAKTTVIQLQDDRQLDIRFSVPESVISQMKRVEDPKLIAGICGTVRFASHAELSYRACHNEHESIPDPLTRTYTAVFSLDKVTDFAALPGMTASVELDLSEFMLDEVDGGLLVPVEGVFEQEGKKWVWRVDSEMRARRIPVGVGRFEGSALEITAGLEVGQRIIAAGVSYVREGLLVKPMVKERGL